ncbi:MAG TPA: bifunctional hydroxymethylpyrimidine kinase/phosphomethylpyrimidine kinase [Capsulimonadaceae bacterium]|jgi:hydroxymethylpyrimidine/phosphomethylpyrimidine kinase
MPVTLTIAGFDPSGGAGVSADLRVIDSLGGNGVSAITALTVQNTRGVLAVHPVDPAILKAQLEALFDDIPIAAVKIGMLAGLPQLQVVLAILRRFMPANIVVDPVIASTGGVPLFDHAAIRTFVVELLPLCHMVTPNLAEAAIMTGVAVHDPGSMAKAGRRLVDGGARNALVKGGHLTEEATDVLVTSDGAAHEFALPRIDTAHSHGTGCFLSSAIAANLANGLRVEEAVKAAKRKLHDALQAPVSLGTGSGYPSSRRYNLYKGEKE